MGIFDDDDLLIDDEETDRVQNLKLKERSTRLGEEAAPYLKKGMAMSWRTTIVWENEVTHSKRLLFMLGALDMIELYSKGTPAEEIFEKYHDYPSEEYSTMLENLKKYFEKGQELFDQLEACKQNSLKI